MGTRYIQNYRDVEAEEEAERQRLEAAKRARRWKVAGDVFVVLTWLAVVAIFAWALVR